MYRTVLLALAVFLYALVCPASSPASHWYVIPVAAHANGVNGTIWKTDLILTNPNDQDIRAVISTSAATDPTGVGIKIEVIVPAHDSVVYRDVLTEFASIGSWSASLYISIQTNLSLYIESYTYTTGPYGQEIQPLVDSEVWETLVCFDDSVYIPIEVTPEYRSNVGFTNGSYGFTATYNVTLHGNGVTRGPVQVTIPPQAIRIYSVEQLFPAHVGSGVIEVTPAVTPQVDCNTIVWGSIVSNTSGDARFLYGRSWRMISYGFMSIEPGD